ncbi:MAG: hypothetical protein BWX50_01625 [Euryarchaeota archaeon ADurb.Bin009]|nr:MAG: hypothetical protein BWX50_01625 [Euryarchaeota archaeon ADurb.Bin009]
MWGATRPMNPMVPVKQMITAVTSDAASMNPAMDRSTGTPRLAATSSPSARALRSHARQRRGGMTATMTIATIPSFGHDDLSSDPNIQKTTSCTLAAVPRYWRRDVIAEKRYMSAIPARIIASLPMPRRRAMP